MGVGDEIMAAGHARVVSEETGRRVQILDYYSRPRWHEIWNGLPWIAAPHERRGLMRIQNGPQCRPYVEYPFTIERGQRWTQWRARDHVGAIALTERETVFANRIAAALGPFVVIEPTLLPKSNQNKQWGKWRDLVEVLTGAGHTVVQMGPNPTATLAGVNHFVKTMTFRAAAAVLSRASAAVLPEGGLHHAAAVLRVPAVVLFGGYISPETTGYPDHVNLAGDGRPCGRWTPCVHCADIWARMSPDYVASHVEGILRTEQAA
jgi:hypothetical protein